MMLRLSYEKRYRPMTGKWTVLKKMLASMLTEEISPAYTLILGSLPEEWVRMTNFSCVRLPLCGIALVIIQHTCVPNVQDLLGKR